jgi:hypothetical protein
MNSAELVQIYWKYQARMCCLVFLVLHCVLAHAQVSAVHTIQNLSFGAFAQGPNGGTITISNNGIASTSGTVQSVNLGGNYLPAQAIFEVEAPPGTIISISNGPDATLKGSNGGTMSLRPGISDPATPFSVTNPGGRTQIQLGGTLTIGNPASNPPGTYTGTFYITFNNE